MGFSIHTFISKVLYAATISWTVISTAPSAMDGWFTISDFTNLWVKSITASGPTLSINLADIVFIELAKPLFR
jgi:hypothetical protein